MNLRDIVGFNVNYANFRKDYRTFYYTPGFEGESFSHLILLEKGIGHFDFAAGRITAKEGAILCFEAKSLKRSMGKPGHPPSYYIISFDLVNRLGHLTKPSEIGIPVYSMSKDFSRLKALARKVAAEWRAKRENFLLRCSILCLQLLEAVQKSLYPQQPPFSSQGKTEDEEHMREVLDFIRRNYKEKISIGNLAQKAGLNPVTFSRVFKRVTGMTPYRYILCRRMEQAKENMINDNYSLLTTSNDLGFSDYSNFNRAFKKFTGMAPSDYVKKLKGIVRAKDG